MRTPEKKKTRSGPFATTLVSLGNSGRYQNRLVSFDAESQFTLASFSSVKGWTETALKSFMANLYFLKMEKNYWLDYWSGRKKIK